MKRLFVVLAVFSVLATSCVIGLPFSGEAGNGKVLSTPYLLPDFDGIKNMSSAQVRISRGSLSKVSVSIDENLAKNLDIRVENGVLLISILPGKSIYNYKEFTVAITVPALSYIGVYGSGDIDTLGEFSGKSISLIIAGSGDISGAFDVDTISAVIDGSGSIDLSGEARDFSGRIQGSGSIRAARLSAMVAKAGIYGSGSCTVRAEQSLDVSIFGSGSVYYYGSPAIASYVDKGSGRLRQLYF